MRYLRSLSCIGLLFVSSFASAGDKPLRDIIDAEVKKAWQAEKITPAGRASDEVFVRRVFLDLAGVIPSYEEATAFLKDADPHKRAKLIDKLLEGPRYGRQQAHIWDLVLFGRHPQNLDATRNRDGFKSWLGERFTKNEPFDGIVKKLLTAEEEVSELFYVQYRGAPEEAATAVSRIFLGTQLQCARCHDHPFEEWTQKDFFGMAGFFVRLVVVDGAGPANKKKFKIAEKSTGDVLFAGSVKELKPGMKGEPVKPRFLGGLELKEPEMPKGFKEPDFKGNVAPPKPAFSRKEKLAEWVTARDNPYFARALANRVWSQFMGRGFVNPVDDLRPKNVPSHPALFKAIETSLIANRFDMKWLIREIVNSETYQVGDAGPIAETMPKYFERASVRPLARRN